MALVKLALIFGLSVFLTACGLIGGNENDRDGFEKAEQSGLTDRQNDDNDDDHNDRDDDRNDNRQKNDDNDDDRDDDNEREKDD